MNWKINHFYFLIFFFTRWKTGSTDPVSPPFILTDIPVWQVTVNTFAVTFYMWKNRYSLSDLAFWNVLRLSRLYFLFLSKVVLWTVTASAGWVKVSAVTWTCPTEQTQDTLERLLACFGFLVFSLVFLPLSFLIYSLFYVLGWYFGFLVFSMFLLFLSASLLCSR